MSEARFTRHEIAELGTAKENADDRTLHGRTSHGESHSLAVRTGQLASNDPYWRHNR